MGKIEEYGYMQIESQHSENFETCVTCGKSGKESEIKKLSIVLKKANIRTNIELIDIVGIEKYEEVEKSVKYVE